MKREFPFFCFIFLTLLIESINVEHFLVEILSMSKNYLFWIVFSNQFMNIFTLKCRSSLKGIEPTTNRTRKSAFEVCVQTTPSCHLSSFFFIQFEVQRKLWRPLFLRHTDYWVVIFFRYLPIYYTLSENNISNFISHAWCFPCQIY